MQFGRINVYPTIATLISITPPDSAHCGDTITFQLTVANARGGGFPVPTGAVQIVDKLTGLVIGNGILSGGAATILAGLPNGTFIPIVNYPGIVNLFGASQSSNTTPYNMNLIDTTTTITTSAGSYFCYHQPFNVTAHVVQNSGAVTPFGSIRFILYSDSVNYVVIGDTTLNGSGNATIAIPANTAEPGNDYHLQAIYAGNADFGCFGGSSSPSGLSGTLLHAIDNDITNTVCGISGINPFCIHQSKTFTATVTGTNLANPSLGSVTWTATKGPTTLTLGTDSTVVSGSASITVPANFFTSQGAWSLHAAYTGDGYCYADSLSSDISITPTEWATTLVVESVPTSFCTAVATTWFTFLSSSTSGTISGSISLYTLGGFQLLGTQTVSGPNTGFYTGFSIPAFTLATGAQNIFAVFTTDLGGCYASDTSPNYPITVHSSGDQHPICSLGVSPGSGAGDTFTTYTFTITVNKNGGAGPLNGAGGLSGKATLYHSTNGISYTILSSTITIFDGTPSGSGTYTQSGFPSGNNYFYAHYNGNSCYAPDDSPVQNIVVNVPPPH